MSVFYLGDREKEHVSLFQNIDSRLISTPQSRSFSHSSHFHLSTFTCFLTFVHFGLYYNDQMKTILHISRYALLYLLLCIATFLMLKGIIAYADFNSTTGFLKYKQDYLDNTVWKTAFYIHVFSSALTLMAGFTQFSPTILKNNKPVHRLAGKIYVYDILFVNFPSGMIMAIYANGLLPSKIAFIVLDTLWFSFTLAALLAIKKRDIITHRQFMIRSYALTLSAITLRTWKMIFTHTTTLDPLTIYMIDAWMGFVPNLLLAEWLIRRKGWKKTKGTIVQV
jgi:hypothetical protein